jgi:hypothetical protein
MRLLPGCVLLLLLVCTGNLPALAAVSMTYSLPAALASHPLEQGPALDPGGWNPGAIPAPGDFYDLTARRPAPYATRVWMLYDTRNLYVAFECAQQGAPIVATQTTNDVGFGTDDFVGVGIDTSGSGTDTYYFEATPRGVRYEQSNENARFQPAWHASSAVRGSSWSSVFVIPLDVMRIHPGSPQNWRINFIRNVAASAEHYTWAYNGQMGDGPIGMEWPNFTDVRYWPSWTGVQVTAALLRASRPKPRAEVYALESAGSDRSVFQQGNGAFAPQTVRHEGLDLSYPLSSTINFVGTLNPDFSNVEVDQQTIAPQEFRRRLVEYRPFFAQGANFIDANPFPFNGLVFYSPDIGAFDRGEKVEGTFGDQSFGVLNFRGFDELTGNTFDDTAYGYNHALPNRSFQYWADGVLAHHSLFGDDATNEAGAGGRSARTGLVWAIDDSLERGSWVPTGNAHSANGFIDVHKQNYEWNIQYVDTSPWYNPIDGFTTNSDLKGPQLYTWAGGSTRAIKTYMLNFFADRYIDGSGAVHQADSSLQLNATFRNGFSLDGLGPALSELRSYALGNPAAKGASCADPLLPRTYYTGYPGYYCGRTDAYDQFAVPIGYGDGTPSPIDAGVSFGRFGYGLLAPGDGQDYVRLYTLSTSRPLGRMFSLGLEYDGTVESGIASGLHASQWLRRISLGAQLGPDQNLTIELRGVSGTGGFAIPGVNVAAAYHRRFASGDLFVNFGTPASPYTLNRFIIKYVFRSGAQEGT